MNLLNRKILWVAGLLGTFALAGSTAIWAGSLMCDENDPEWARLKELMRHGGLTVEEIQVIQRDCAQRRAWSNMTPQKRATIQEQSFKQFLQDQRQLPSSSGPKGENRFLGVLSAQDAPMPPFGYADFRTFGYWGGILKGQEFGVRSGATQENPQQGVVLVTDATTAPSAKIYKAPTATGPLQILSEKDGTITLHSLAGDWDVYDVNSDKHSSVNTPGGVIYHFNVTRRAFTQ